MPVNTEHQAYADMKSVGKLSTMSVMVLPRLRSVANFIYQNPMYRLI